MATVEDQMPREVAKTMLPPVLSWAIVISLAVIIAGMAATPFVPAGVRFVPAFSAAVGFFVLYGLVKRAAVIRGW